MRKVFLAMIAMAISAAAFAQTEVWVYSKGGRITKVQNVDSVVYKGKLNNAKVAKVIDATYTVHGVSFKMITVPAGTFKMGTQNTNSKGLNYDSDAETDEFPLHDVTLSQYQIGETEVTQALWEAVMGKDTEVSKQWSDDHGKGPNYPVNFVSWYDAQDFVAKLNSLLADKLNGKKFTLPTEAQWEYAARGARLSEGFKYAGSNEIDTVAWCELNAGGKTHEVKRKKPNELGLYDMSGNVFEWCSDIYGDYTDNEQTDPTGAELGTRRILRGGYWNKVVYCRVGNRYFYVPTGSGDGLGFRLALQ